MDKLYGEIDKKISDDCIEFNKNIESNMRYRNEISSDLLNLEWLDLLENACPYIDNIIRNPKLTLIREENVNKIEKVRKTSVESVKNLAVHSQYIEKIDDLTKDVQPSKLLEVYNVETYNIYENRVIYTLLDKLNRFIANRHTYEHNDVVISFVAKVSFDDKSEEVMINIKVDKDDNIYDLSRKISQKVDRIRNSKETKKENTNNIVDIVGKLPKIIRVPLMGMFKFLDKKGMLPESFIKDNLYYSSIILSNLGNLKIGSIYHNLTNFGTSSFLATIGLIHKETIVDFSGKEKVVDICDFGINCDERIADGYYFTKSIKLFEYIIENPELLEDKACEKVEIK